MCAIEPITWEAVATLAAGGAAVAGAVFVGIKQTTILKRQVRMADLAIREATFDRRFKVYEATSEYLMHMSTDASAPPYELERAFKDARSKARFLFGPGVLNLLDEAYGVATDYATGKASSRSNDAAEDKRATKEHQEVRRRLQSCVDRLPVVFADEMSLLEAARPPARY
ncbi:hypothetical protein BH10PSE5_BH10PSE5_00040 [soil metagenome]